MWHSGSELISINVVAFPQDKNKIQDIYWNATVKVEMTPQLYNFTGCINEISSNTHYITLKVSQEIKRKKHTNNNNTNNTNNNTIM